MEVTTRQTRPQLESGFTVPDYIFIMLAIVFGAGPVPLLVVGERIGLTIRFVGWSEKRISSSSLK